jgi:hypothetical protein
MECYQGSTAMNNELSRVVNVVASESDRKLNQRVVDRGHDSTIKNLFIAREKGEKQCHTLQSEKKIQATLSFTMKTMARASRLF